MNPVFHAQTKCIEIYHHFVQEEGTLLGPLMTRHVRSTLQVADSHMKPLARVHLTGLRLKPGLWPNPLSEVPFLRHIPHHPNNQGKRISNSLKT